MFLKWRDEVTARVHVFKTAQYYICLNINTSSSRLIFFPLIHFLILVSFDTWFELDKKCDDFDGVHIILLLGICNLLVFSPSLQSIYLDPANGSRLGSGSRPMRAQGSVTWCRIRGRVRRSLRGEHAACTPPAKECARWSSSKRREKNHQNEDKILKTSLALCNQTTVNH